MEASTSAPRSGAAMIERSKVSKACTICTSRRTKCSGELPTCKYCLKAGVECTYLATVKRGPKKGAKYKQRQNKEKPEKEEDELSPQGSIESTSTLPALCAVASASESVDSPPRKRYRNESTSLPAPNQNTVDVSPPLLQSHQSYQLQQQQQQQQILQQQQQQQQQQNHQQLLLQQQQQQHQQQQGIPQNFPNNIPQPPPIQNQFHIPNLSSEVLHHLIPIFFSHVNYQGFSILHEPSFLLALSENKVGPALLYAISAAASAFSTHPSVQLSSVPGGPTSNSGIVWAVASRKCLLAQVDSQFTLQGVQTLAILSAWELAQGCGETSWVDIGTAVRAAQIMGFDDGSELEAVYDGPVPQTEIALRQRIVWTLFSLEVILGCGARSISLLGGVASSVALESLPLPMLGNWEKVPGDDFADDEEIPTLFLGGGRIMHSLGVCGVEPFLCRSLEIYARLNRFLNLTRITNASSKIRRLSAPISGTFPMTLPKGGARDWDPASPFAKLSLDLSTWNMHLPTPFAFNATSIITLSTSQLSSFYTMHLVYHLGQVALHRPYLPDFRYQPRQFPPPVPTDGYSVFVNSCHRKAAVHAISLARVLVSATKNASFAISPLAGYCAFTGATALLFDADMRGSSAASQALQFFLRFLLTGADFYSSLRPFHACLSTLIALHQSVHPEPALSPLPRGPSDIVPDFFFRYEAYGIKEPLLAPVLIRGPNTPRQELPQPLRAPTPATEEDGYLSHLREILAAVEENWDDETRPSLSVPRSPIAPAQVNNLPLPSAPNLSATSNLHFTSKYDPFLPIPAASPLAANTPASEAGPSNGSHLSMTSPIAQSPYSFNHHNPHNKIVNYDPYPPPTPAASSSSSTTLSHHISILNHQNTNAGSPNSEVDTPDSRTNNQHHQHHQNSENNNNRNNNNNSSNPADIFTWLFSEPVAESIWDDQALEGFLGAADWPLYSENSGIGGDGHGGISLGGGMGRNDGRMEIGRDFS